MKPNKLHLLYLLLVLSAGCRKESALSPSAPVADPFIRIDNPNSPVDHTIYQVYQATGVPILYADTISKNPVFVINLAYHLTGTDALLYLVNLQQQDTTDILAGVDFVRDSILPHLGGSLKPYSVLLMDSIVENTYTMQTSDCYLGLNTLAIGNVPAIAGSSPADLKAYQTNIFSTYLTIALAGQPAALNAFYAVSSAYYYNYIDSWHGYTAPFPPPMQFGILPDQYTDLQNGYYIQDGPYDLSLYINAYTSMSQSDFMQQYGNYPLCVQKYQLLQQALSNLGYKN